MFPTMHRHAIPVLIRNAAGLYLATSGPDFVFTPNPAQAHVFDFIQDDVAARVESARALLAEGWTVVRADPRAGFEVCDRCGRRVMAFKAVFDGRGFRCAECFGAAAS